jgi:RNA polymerase sigma-70 factor, ECF subfamily
MSEANAVMHDKRDIGSDAFMNAIEPLIPVAHRLAYGMLRSRDEANDIVQDAILNAWRHRSSLREGSRIRPWFLAVVANQCRQAVRARWWSVIRRPDLPSVSRAEGRFEIDDVESLRQGLLKLPDRDRLVLVLRYYLDLSFEDMGSTLRISPQAARVRTHRALSRLRPIMDIPGDLTDE